MVSSPLPEPPSLRWRTGSDALVLVVQGDPDVHALATPAAEADVLTRQHPDAPSLAKKGDQCTGKFGWGVLLDEVAGLRDQPQLCARDE
jgi:hypothetical protein